MAKTNWFNLPNPSTPIYDFHINFPTGKSTNMKYLPIWVR